MCYGRDHKSRSSEFENIYKHQDNAVCELSFYLLCSQQPEEPKTYK